VHINDRQQIGVFAGTWDPDHLYIHFQTIKGPGGFQVSAIQRFS
jgi:hypothetical protein